MPITLGRNISSLQAQYELAKSSERISRVYERLSSGMRINRAADDAAGLSVATLLNADTRIARQAINNINDGVSLLNIAEEALNALSAITMRGMELAQQAAQGTYSKQQRRAMQEESDALVDEYNRIIQSTSFNGQQILSNSAYQLAVQAGSGASAVIASTLGSALARTAGDGTISQGVDLAASVPTNLSVADLNGDGNIDILAAGTSSLYYFGNGDGTFKAGVTLTSVNTFSFLRSADVNEDGVMDIIGGGGYVGSQVSVFLGLGAGTFAAEQTYAGVNNPRDINLTDVNGDGHLDLIEVNLAPIGLSVLLGNGNGSFKSAVNYAATASPSGLQVADMNGDNILDLITTNAGAGDSIGLFYGNGDGTFKAQVALAVGDNPVKLEIGDLDRDGDLDMVVTDNLSSSVSVVLSNGNGSYNARVSYAAGPTQYGLTLVDYNGDGILDIGSVDSGANDTFRIMIGNGDGTFGNARTFSIPASTTRVVASDFNGDGVADVAVNSSGDNLVRIFLGNTRQITSIGYLSVDSVSEAQSALTTWSSTLTRISLEQANVGASLSRLETAQRFQQATALAYSEAAARITDADIAQESAELIRLQILQKSSAAILAQANQSPQIALKLLRQ